MDYKLLASFGIGVVVGYTASKYMESKKYSSNGIQIESLSGSSISLSEEVQTSKMTNPDYAPYIDAGPNEDSFHDEPEDQEPEEDDEPVPDRESYEHKKKIHYHTSNKEKGNEIMEVNEQYRLMMTRGMSKTPELELLLHLDNYMVYPTDTHNEFPVLDPITMETSIEERSEMFAARGIILNLDPTWFDIYMRFLSAFDGEEKENKMIELMRILDGHMESIAEDHNYRVENNLAEVLEAYEYGNLIEPRAIPSRPTTYSPFGLTMEDKVLLDLEHRDTLEGQKNLWITTYIME